ncbi:hypothetical protein WJX79_010871 [Trebouxia sp. C0005]
MEQHGNKSTYNIETVLRKNIVDSEYWRNTCAKLQTWEEVVDQIFYDVIHVEPWMSGNARGASSAFGLLYRLCQLQPSEEQVDALLTHEDSPYIRAIGFLYLRYVGDPKQLWAWLRPYVQDSEEISPSGESGTAVTVGDYVRDVFLEQYYFETIFPRIPKPVNDEWVGKLRGMGLPAKAVGNGGQGGPDRRGLDEPNRRPASVKASLSVAFGQRAPNRATAREEGRGLGAGMKNVYNGTREERPRSSSRDARSAAEKRPAEAAPYAQAHGRHHRDRKTDSDRDRYSKRYCSRDPAHDADARPPRIEALLDTMTETHHTGPIGIIPAIIPAAGKSTCRAAEAPRQGEAAGIGKQLQIHQLLMLPTCINRQLHMVQHLSGAMIIESLSSLEPRGILMRWCHRADLQAFDAEMTDAPPALVGQ